MKEKLIFTLICCAALMFSGCSRSVLSRFVKQYRCQNPALENPKTAGDFLYVSRVHLNKDEIDCAYQAAEEAVRLEPGNGKAYSSRADAEVARKNLDAALADYSKSIELLPVYPESYYGRSFVWEEKDDLDKAIADMTQAISFAPHDADRKSSIPYWLDQRGSLYMGIENYEKALADFDSAVRLTPDFHLFYRHRANALRSLGRLPEAETDERKANQLKGEENSRKP